MIDFEKISGPFGVPVYFQRLPVNTVSIYWMVFVGSADDDAGGGHGIYHWFEHIPSRGTEKFPGGYFDTEARLVRHGGGSDAETGFTFTGFSADIPKRVWPNALEILAEMIGRPLLRTEDIEAEREVILQEIDEWHSSPYSESVCRLPSTLWPGHSLGHDQLGSRETLKSIDPKQLRLAHESGYSRNRCALFIAGDIERSQLMDVVEQCMDRIPDRRIEPRSRPATYGALPKWQSGKTSFIETSHEDSVVYLLFPMQPHAAGIAPILEWDFLSEIFSAGELGSPLNRLVREDSQLAYSPEFTFNLHPDGGYAGLVAQTSVEPERVVDAFWKLILGDEIRSPDWLDYVRDTIRGELEMHDPDAGQYTSEGSLSLIHYGQIVSDEEYSKAMLGFRDAEVTEWLDRLNPKQAHTIIFQGSDS